MVDINSMKTGGASMVINLSHQKGGVGKSTLATNLAVELKAVIIDLDSAPDGDLGPVVPPPSAPRPTRGRPVRLPQAK